MVFIAASQGMHLDLVALGARGRMKRWEDREV